MGMKPQQFFDAFVIGNRDDFRDHPDSLRHAFNAALTASHMADHYFEFHRRHSTTFQFKSLKDLCDYATNATDSAFRIVKDIANAYKHLYVTKYVADVTSAGAVEYVSSNRRADSVREIDTSDEEGVVQVTTRDGSVVRFEVLLDSVLRFWDEFLQNGTA